MSQFSGKADLADFISMMGDDDLSAFYAFKKATGGVIYQHRNIKEVNVYNQDFVKEHCERFDIVKHENKTADVKGNGFKTTVSYTYIYWGKEYTAKELKKRGGVYLEMPIKFEGILDLIKYYPYIVSVSCWDGEKKKSHIVISNQSYVDEQYEEMLQFGHLSMKDYYDRELAEYYHKMAKRIDRRLEERTNEELLDSSKLTKVGDHYEYPLNHDIDCNHRIDWFWVDGRPHNHWTSPKLKEKNIVVIDKQDVELYLKDHIKSSMVGIKYVQAEEE